MTRILCLWLPNWPIQRLTRARPKLKNRPVALAASGPRGGQVVVCSSRAAAEGVHAGMPVAEAQALVRELIVAPHEPLADRRALEKLAEMCEQFSPFVALEECEESEPESLLLDISNLDHLWGGEGKLLARVEAWFKRRGYAVRLAVAETIGLAWALAHFGKEDCKMQNAKCKFSIAEREPTFEDFNSQFAIRNLRFAISSLPVEALRVAGDTAALLRQLGVQTVGQLQALPREDLSSRFGDELLLRLDQLTGAVLEVLRPHRAVAALQVISVLDEPTADQAVLMHVLTRLVERLTRRLAARDEGVVVLECMLQLPGLSQPSDFPSRGQVRGDRRRAGGLEMRIGLVEPSANARQILELVELHLENVRLAEEVDRVELRAAVTGRLGERQRDLFAERWPSDSHQFSLLVSRLSSRLGEERVLRTERRASAVPEQAVRFVPMTGRTVRKLQNAICNLQSPRPLLLEREPQGLEVVCVAPDGPPRFVWLAGRRERIVDCAGPERIETLWWRGPSVRRDYYRVTTESGSHLWIFRRRQDARWFLHGCFD